MKARWGYSTLPRGGSHSPPQVDPAQCLVVGLQMAVLGIALACGDAGTVALDAGQPATDRDVIIERLIPVEGTRNFRDVGGYRTFEGRSVRRGMIYRSDHLASLTHAGEKRLTSLAIRSILDLRTDAEREKQPDSLPTIRTPSLSSLPMTGGVIDRAKLQERVLHLDFEGTDPRQALIESHRSYVTNNTAELAALLRHFADPGNLPGLIHGTMGKDRTGVAVAVLLLALGVPRHTILADYELSDDYTAQATNQTLFIARLLSGLQSDPELARPLFEARAEYLEAAFAAIDEQFGSDDAYLESGLGLNSQELKQLRHNLLR